MKSFTEILNLAAKVSNSRELELVYVLTDDALFCGTMTDEQCRRIYDMLETRNV